MCQRMSINQQVKHPIHMHMIMCVCVQRVRKFTARMQTYTACLACRCHITDVEIIPAPQCPHMAVVLAQPMSGYHLTQPFVCALRSDFQSQSITLLTKHYLAINRSLLHLPHFHLKANTFQILYTNKQTSKQTYIHTHTHTYIHSMSMMSTCLK